MQRTTLSQSPSPFNLLLFKPIDANGSSCTINLTAKTSVMDFFLRWFIYQQTAQSKTLLYCNIVILMWRTWTFTRKAWRCCWVGFGQPRDQGLLLGAMVQSNLSSLVSSVMSHLHYWHHRFESAVLGTLFFPAWFEGLEFMDCLPSHRPMMRNYVHLWC